jgi:four helix bundle protein
MLHVYEIARSWLRSLRPVLEHVHRHDKDLCRQMRRAGASVLLNIAEGARRMGRDCRQHFLIAAGSTRTCHFPALLAKLQDWQRGRPKGAAVNAELRAALDVCDAFGYMQPEIYRQLDRQLDSVAAMLYRLTH